MVVDLEPIFAGNLDPAKIIKQLSIVSGKEIIPGKTLLFFDEIQAIPRAILALRYFYEDMKDLHVIGAGSLLDFAIEQVGLPVGRVESLFVYPLSFLEFLSALDQSLAIQEIINHNTQEPAGEAIHTKFLSLLGEYLAVGGMPEAVQLFKDERYLECFKVHQTIITTYQQDFNKYAKNTQLKYLDTLFKNIPMQIGKKFKFSDVGEYRKRELMPALELLQTARVIHVINRTVANGIPLGALRYTSCGSTQGERVAREDFKVILLDIAINQVMLGEKKGITTREELGAWFLKSAEQFINKGNIVEAFVAQEIIAYSNPEYEETLYCWRRDAQGSEAEVDYVVQLDQQIIPIEVKSGKGTTLRSMNLFLEAHPGSPYGIKFSTQDYSEFEKIRAYPLYAIASVLLYDKEVVKALL